MSKIEWIETTVGEYCPFIYGKALPQSKRISVDIPVYGSNGIVDFHNSSCVDSAGIIIGRKGSVGAVHLSEKPFWVIDTAFYVVNDNIEELKFIYYLLKTLGLSEMNSDSAVPGLNRENAHSLRIKIPKDKFHRREIGKRLSIFDEKIQLNTQINQTLEHIAQAIFKSWFVDFDPVRSKVAALSDGKTQAEAELAAMSVISGKTAEELTVLEPERYAELAEIAAAFPNEMGEVDGVEVPKGWEVKRIDGVANIIKGKSYKSSELEESTTALVTLKSFNRGGGYRLDGLKEYTGKYKSEQEVFSGELIIAYTDVTQAADVIGKPAMVMSDSRYEHLIISLDVGVVRPFDDVYKYFLYCLAMTDSFQAHTKSFCTGTTVLHLGKDAVPSFEFVNPNGKLLKAFCKQTSPIFEKINLHIEENKNLEKTRDLLLPRLLSGDL
ncbi:restriction endonuclease subunit S [Eikenella sp. S3360]|uniref:Restriction endonuclease subunit S n=1 Tax=Eikenella glucosivorans TaxID=2766967 RepID=A0ABS0N888_9NEIS|nr:restriction endonuclease subunit S [Eikenella glucosivorans]MBH5328519.1 restriction endonuclease subunit S [Eikenella glucosivorans]